MYFITGDCHGDFSKIRHFCKRNSNVSKDDTMILLGDVGLNYFLNESDRKRKKAVSELPLTFFCVHGNHEERPYNVASYEEKEWHGGTVYYEPEFPNLLFAKDGEIYDFNGKKAIVIGGAYSVDKEYRLMYGYSWFESEQPTQEIKDYVEQQLGRCGWKVDYVFSHTGPLRYEPRELFLDFIDQSKVDKSTEEWLDRIESRLQYSRWYFGHYHGNKEYDKLDMLYEGIKELGKNQFVQRVGIPQYRVNEKVLFIYYNGNEALECYGTIEIVDEFGSLEVPNEVSYDIYGPDYRDETKKVLYKHIRESDIEMVI